MNFEYLFCGQIKMLVYYGFPILFNKKSYNNSNFNEDCDILDKTIDNLYDSNTEDIEDFTDIISILNESCYYILKNYKFSLDQCKKILDLRIKAKNKTYQKYKDYKYNKRRFWNDDKAELQYYNLNIYIWKPSVEKIEELLRKRQSKK